MSSQNNYDKENINIQCCCERPKTNIICANCGYTMFGRIRFMCPIHWQTTFLCDISKCARCRADGRMLIEFDSGSHGKLY
ncbi:hypothetical protein TSAR_016618 [Trichomalopsis sarcophagae]|uniref:Uncharacterized protein n=1 Tax=Trichomalopsis sarcophagae TaxID=543379 RepID=A0A232ETB5_9HYME|nr:hypothetical protein TSAR_016618 [Trichomalopsis sarcophagae]